MDRRGVPGRINVGSARSSGRLGGQQMGQGFGLSVGAFGMETWLLIYDLDFGSSNGYYEILLQRCW